MNIKLFFFGKKNEITSQEKELFKRINFRVSAEFCVLPQAGIKGNAEEITRKESDTFLKKIKDTDTLIAFDQHGKEYNSQEFSAQVTTLLESKKELVFVIGGAYGLDKNILERADLVVCFGKMVWTRNLFRTMVCEQLYRAFEIANNSHFHK